MLKHESFVLFVYLYKSECIIHILIGEKISSNFVLLCHLVLSFFLNASCTELGLPVEILCDPR